MVLNNTTTSFYKDYPPSWYGVVMEKAKMTKKDTPKVSNVSNGTTASYYELPDDATELQHLISHRNMNAQDGEMFRSLYRKGMASHSDELRDARKVQFYARAEVARLEKLVESFIGA